MTVAGNKRLLLPTTARILPLSTSTASAIAVAAPSEFSDAQTLARSSDRLSRPDSATSEFDLFFPYIFSSSPDKPAAPTLYAIFSVDSLCFPGESGKCNVRISICLCLSPITDITQSVYLQIRRHYGLLIDPRLYLITLKASSCRTAARIRAQWDRL